MPAKNNNKNQIETLTKTCCFELTHPSGEANVTGKLITSAKDQPTNARRSNWYIKVKSIKYALLSN